MLSEFAESKLQGFVVNFSYLRFAESNLQGFVVNFSYLR